MMSMSCSATVMLEESLTDKVFNALSLNIPYKGVLEKTDTYTVQVLTYTDDNNIPLSRIPVDFPMINCIQTFHFKEGYRIASLISRFVKEMDLKLMHNDISQYVNKGKQYNLCYEYEAGEISIPMIMEFIVILH